MTSPKKLIRRVLARLGYVVHRVERGGGVTGVDMLHDVRAFLQDRAGLVVFDIGANIGQSVEQFSETFPRSRFYSFEPSPATFEELRRRAGGRPGVILENLAVGDQEGTLPFYVSRDFSVNDSLLRTTWDSGAGAVTVQVTTLDRYCEEHGIPAIDFLKIDAQGYDLSVLRGASRMLRERRIGVFCAELTISVMYENQPNYLEMLTFIKGLGYDLVGFYDQTYSCGRLQYLNACFACPADTTARDTASWSAREAMSPAQGGSASS